MTEIYEKYRGVYIEGNHIAVGFNEKRISVEKIMSASLNQSVQPGQSRPLD